MSRAEIVENNYIEADIPGGKQYKIVKTYIEMILQYFSTKCFFLNVLLCLPHHLKKIGFSAPLYMWLQITTWKLWLIVPNKMEQITHLPYLIICLYTLYINIKWEFNHLMLLHNYVTLFCYSKMMGMTNSH